MHSHLVLAKLDGVDVGKVNKRALCDVSHLNKYTMAESESVLFKVLS